MTGKYVMPEPSEPQYLAQRYYLGSLCYSASLFFALGNHDGESGSRGSTVWASKTRKRLFPKPEPDKFYTGNNQSDPEVGLPEDYYQWRWGDAELDRFDIRTPRRLIINLNCQYRHVVTRAFRLAPFVDD